MIYHLPMVYETDRPRRPLGFLQRHEPTDIQVPPPQPPPNDTFTIDSGDLSAHIAHIADHFRHILDMPNQALFNKMLEMIEDFHYNQQHALVVSVHPDTAEFEGAIFTATITHTDRTADLLDRAIAETRDEEVRDYLSKIAELLAEPLEVAHQKYEQNKDQIERHRPTGNEVCPATS